MNGWAKRFYANEALLDAHPALKDDLARVIEQSAFKVIEEKERAKDYEGAAEEYLAFARDWPRSRLAPTALYNASVDYVRAHRLDRAMDDPRAAPPAVPRTTRSRRSASTTTPRRTRPIADFARGGRRCYERYFREWRKRSAPSRRGAKAEGEGKGKAQAAAAHAPAGRADEEKKANDAIINAAVFRAGLREWARAEAATEAYLETWPGRRRRAAALPRPRRRVRGARASPRRS